MLIQNDQETRASAVNKDETPVVTGTDQVVTTPSVEENDKSNYCTKLW